MTTDVAAAAKPPGNHNQAMQFLSRLDPEADAFTFQTFDDTPAKRKDLARVLPGPFKTMAPILDILQRKQAGVFVTVNATDGKGRQAHNIERVRAVFVDLDGAPLAPVLSAGLDPHIVVESSPSRFHAYWLTDDCPLDRFEAVQRALARRFDGDPSVHDLPRVMRLPGFRHFKRDVQTTKILEDLGTSVAPYSLAEIVGTLDLRLDADTAKSATSHRSGDVDGMIGPGERHDHLFASARSMARRMSPDAVRAALTAENVARCSPPLPDADIDYLAQRAFEAKPAQGWQDAKPAVTGSEFPNLDNGAVPETNHTPPPVDLLRPMAAPPLRTSDVPEVLAKFADAYAQATGFDVSILLLGGIVAAAAMITDELRLCVASRSSWFESARLWGTVIAGPGAGKTPALKAVQAPMFALHRELLGEWSRAHGEEEEPPPRPAIYTSDATTEALAELLRDNPRGVLYTVDELHSWLESHDAYRNGGGKDRGEWLRLFDGGAHQVHRIKRGAFFVQNWGASVLSATTPAALRKLAKKLPDDGLLQRLLLVVARPRELANNTLLTVETKRPTDAWDDAMRRLYALPGAVVHLSLAARDAFEAEQASLHALTMAMEDAHPSYAAHLAKRAAMLARLALVFHALEAPTITNNLHGDTMERAARFLRRQERHAMTVYASLLGTDTGMALAQAIARSILASRLQSFNRRVLTPACKAFRNADEWTRTSALSMLCDFGWLTVEGTTVTHGTQWIVDMRVHTLFAEQGAIAMQRRETVRARFAEIADDGE